ncbi:hypothetical protein [Breoghania sp.]|uniref:hypothetical protein n=1 Tax=Breoghania sp. TaxID=2065378 RepID=UPI002637878F|nr:hypothetical protein [Breoghania sp.]MDJ0930562.1 hypothetical protein [Breoghania sp.]
MERDDLSWALDHLDSDNPCERLAACRTLVSRGAINTAEPVLDELGEREALAREVDMLRSACRYIRRVLIETRVLDEVGNPALSEEAEQRILAGRSFDDFYMLRKEEGSDNLIIVFTCMGQSFGVSLALLLRILKHFDCHVIFLQDRNEQYYFGGVEGLDGSWINARPAETGGPEAVGKENLLSRPIGWRLCRHSVCGGSSRTRGPDLRACHDAGLVVANGDLRCDALPGGPENGLPQPLDLAVQLKRAKPVPHIGIVFGALAEEDAAQAERLRHEAVEHVRGDG